VPELPDRPLPNSYWVVPGRLLAGEYPGAREQANTLDRVGRLLQAGLTQFIDLTVAEELPPYHTLLPADIAGRPVLHHRYSIPDHDVPESAELVTAALDAIDRALGSGTGVYLHCRAGIGRTGLVAGCWLARHGNSGDEALEQLAELWSQSERSRHWNLVPETDEQAEFVRQWRESPQPSGRATVVAQDLAERYQGALLGLAMGDALGSTSGRREPHAVFSGVWTADTAMTLCIARSLLERGCSDPADQMNQLLRWSREGWLSATGEPLGLGPEVRRALAQFVWSRKPLAGSHDPGNRDPHPLPRVLAPVLAFRCDPGPALVAAVESARITLQSPLVLDACRYFAALLLAALQGCSRADLLERQPDILADKLELERLRPELRDLSRGGWRRPRESATPPDAVAVLASALQAFEATEDFRAGLHGIIRTTAAPSTAGAVFGALAGAVHGRRGLPGDWRSKLARAAELEALALELLAQSQSAG